MSCESCRFNDRETCLMQVNINVIYEEGSQKADCPYWQSKHFYKGLLSFGVAAPGCLITQKERKDGKET